VRQRENRRVEDHFEEVTGGAVNRRRIHSSAGLIIVSAVIRHTDSGCLVEVTRAQAGAEATYLSAQHRDVVERLARSEDRTLRLATANDCTNKSGLAAMRKEKGRKLSSVLCGWRFQW